MLNNFEDILPKLKSNDPTAQKELYEQYKGLFFGIVRRYISNTAEAEDVFVEAFYKILSKVNEFQGNGSFEGWMKRIMVNEALMHLRKKNILNHSADLAVVSIGYSQKIEDKIDHEKIILALQSLPPGYRTIFNLYVIEGYKHREIAEMLNISINTSKSQLIWAKKKIREILEKELNIKSSKYGA